MESFISDLSQRQYPVSERVPARTIRHSVLHLMQKENPNINHNSSVSLSELNEYRHRILLIILPGKSRVNELEKTVLDSLSANGTIRQLDGDEQQNLTFGQRIADRWLHSEEVDVHHFVHDFSFLYGSVSIFTGFRTRALILTLLSSLIYPSCIASLQAPVIMMTKQTGRKRRTGLK
jgi:hypothetical protein